MRHPNDGPLKALVDGAATLSVKDRARIRAHLQTCSQCAQRATELERRAASVDARMSSLAPQTEPVAKRVAHRRLAAYIQEKQTQEKEEGTMLNRLLSRRYRWAWGIAALCGVIALALAFSPVRALADEFLALFRVQKIAFVEFNPLDLPDDEMVRSAAYEMERFAKEKMTYEVEGEPQVVDLATAQAMTPFTVRLPSALADPALTVQPAMHLAMEVDLEQVRALMRAMGYDEVTLPETLEGADVSMDIEPSVTSTYGPCEARDGGDCTLFIQLPSPKVTAPPEIDMQQLGLLYLRMLGMSQSEAARFSRRIDWTTTLVVPIPSTEAKHQDVRVDGVMGALIQPRVQRNGPDYALMWVKDDVVYALIGEGDKATALNIANSLE